jgi:integrase
MAVYKRGKIWWYKFTWNGEPVRESTKQSNKRTAEQMEATHKTSLAKGEVGLRDRKLAPTLADFAEKDFLPFVRSTSAGKPRTVSFYENTAKNIIGFAKLANLRMDAINADVLAEFGARRREAGMETSTINRDLATVRRMFHLAQEWGRVATVLPKVKMLAGEKQRERVLTHEEEQKYMDAVTELGRRLDESYRLALTGIRAVRRGEQPQMPDAYLLRDVAAVLLDCGLRPEECHRLKWENLRDGAIEVFVGKRKASRRRVPASQRVLSILEMRQAASKSDWIFPSDTASGHIEASTLKKRHSAAVTAAKVAPFVPYDMRHTCLTRWAKVMDPFTLKKLAGHTDLNTTMRYVHLNDDDVRTAMEKVRRGHKSGHTANLTEFEEEGRIPATDTAKRN